MDDKTETPAATLPAPEAGEHHSVVALSRKSVAICNR